MAIITVPGIGGSGEAHWQTLWEQADPHIVRFRPASWDAPDLADWISALDHAVAASAEHPILVAHSLGCLLVAHWAARIDRPIVRGALLVAVPDPDGAAFPKTEAATFREVPDWTLPFPALIIASQNDPYASVQHAWRCAKDWRAGLIVLGELGHINGDSGIGAWPEGARLLTAFQAGTGPLVMPLPDVGS